MLASNPANMVNQKQADLGIPNRFKLTPSRSKALELRILELRASRNLAAVLIDDRPARLRPRNARVTALPRARFPGRGDDVVILHGHEMVTQSQAASCVTTPLMTVPSPRRHLSSLRQSPATKQSIALQAGCVDCFAQAGIGRGFARHAGSLSACRDYACTGAGASAYLCASHDDSVAGTRPTRP